MNKHKAYKNMLTRRGLDNRLPPEYKTGYSDKIEPERKIKAVFRNGQVVAHGKSWAEIARKLGI